MDPHNLPTNPKPTSLQTRFAHRFIRALNRLNKQRKPFPSSSTREFYKRSIRVKMVADAAMASVVGSRRAWSRALLWKIRNQSRRHSLVAKKSNSHAKRLRKSKVVRPKIAKCENFDQASELRRLVPGGEAMEYSNLLKETAHYIKCLATQVQVMRNIVDLLSA